MRGNLGFTARSLRRMRTWKSGIRFACVVCQGKLSLFLNPQVIGNKTMEQIERLRKPLEQRRREIRRRWWIQLHPNGKHLWTK
jgi:sRNA-binding protein